MGNIFSGRHGRRSSKPYFDELPRITIGELKSHPSGTIFLTAAGCTFTVRLIRIPVGCMTAPRLVCAFCGRACRVIYLHGAACCYRCSGARYRSTCETPARRALRAAKVVWRKHVLQVDYKRPAGKPRWMRWPTYDRLEAAADAVSHIVVRDSMALFEAEAAFKEKLAAKRKVGRPKKNAPQT